MPATNASDYERWPNLPAMFFERAQELDARPLFWAKKEGRYAPLSWRDAAAQANALARGLRALGIAPGERVALISENRPEWGVADVAIMAAGALTVPAYTTNTTRDHRHVLIDSGASAAIVSTPRLAARVLPAVLQSPALKFVVGIERIREHEGTSVKLFPWTDVLALGRREPDDLGPRLARIAREDVACLIYTSGTGGNPKGVMLSHRAILHNCRGAYRLLEEFGLSDEVFLSILPLSHSYEHTAGLHFPISIGAQIYYAEGVETLANNFVEARPTLMIAVPRLYEVMRQRILRGVERQGGFKAKLFRSTLELGSRAYAKGGALPLGPRLLDRVLDRLVRTKVRARFGGRLKAMVSGGAPLNHDVGLFFTALGVRVLQGYGQTEAAPVIACNPPGKVKLRTVGPPVEGVEVKIADDGEVLVRGPLVMNGYWNNPEATAEVLREGWLNTGDIGRFDEDGYLLITDRKKDIIVISGGDNISPQRVEGILALQPEIAQAMVYGDRHPHLVALIVADAAFAERWSHGHGVPADPAALSQNPEFVKRIAKAVEAANLDLSVIERIKRFALAKAPFTIDNAQLTPTLKLKRHAILAEYRESLEALY